MDESKAPGPFSIPQPACPYFQPAQADWIYPVPGYCRGLPQGLLMIPSIEEYRALCSTAQHTTCLICRGRQGDTGAEAAVRDACRSGGPFPSLTDPPARGDHLGERVLDGGAVHAHIYFKKELEQPVQCPGRSVEASGMEGPR